MFSEKIILFPDVNLIADREYAMRLFKEMKSLNKYWMGLVTSSVGIDENMIKTFADSGCKGLFSKSYHYNICMLRGFFWHK